MKKKIKILSVVGARPNFIKIAPLLNEMKKYSQIKSVLVHTGQHYDFKMSGIFFKDLNIPRPDYNLGIGSGSHAEQTGKVMIALEKVCLKEKPDLIIVLGDVNSTLAAGLTASKLYIPVAHIEAGLRSFDRKMPEEINRVLIDQISDLLFVSDPSGVSNLVREGVSHKKIFYVGNIMIDSLKTSKPKIAESKILSTLNLQKKKYAVLTLHRPSNVDNKKTFEKIINILNKVQEKTKIIWLLHPRTKQRIKEFAFNKKISKLDTIKPLGYIDTLCLISNSCLVMTDSGGIQEETTILKIPCLTLRENTERPVTIEQGTNILVGTNKNKILRQIKKILIGKGKKGRQPKYWDGKTSQRIMKIIATYVK